MLKTVKVLLLMITLALLINQTYLTFFYIVKYYRLFIVVCTANKLSLWNKKKQVLEIFHDLFILPIRIYANLCQEWSMLCWVSTVFHFRNALKALIKKEFSCSEKKHPPTTPLSCSFQGVCKFHPTLQLLNMWFFFSFTMQVDL